MVVFRAFLKTALLSYCLFCLSPLYAVDLGSFGERIFQFQEKLANNGNKLAQYKLGTLYEFGISVAADPQQARLWYEKSASQGYQPAIDRLTYLQVKQDGYDENRHREWFERVLTQAEAYEPDSLILLGQMNRHGIVVEQDLELALNLLQQASSLGHTEVDSQIDELKRQIQSQQRVEARKQAEAEKARQGKARQAKAKAVQQAKVVDKPAKVEPAKAEIDAQAEAEARRLRYEKAMRQLYKEELLLQQQQEWAESIPPVE
jgi:hypothetical protein